MVGKDSARDGEGRGRYSREFLCNTQSVVGVSGGWRLEHCSLLPHHSTESREILRQQTGKSAAAPAAQLIQYVYMTVTMVTIDILSTISYIRF